MTRASSEEERRLAYVAITRARKRLFLTYAATRRTYGSTSANPRSRFLNEIPFEDIEFSGIGSAGFEGTGWEKRGDRHGTFGSGMGSDMYGGKVFGSHTRSTGGSGSRGGSSFDDFFGGSSYGTERHRGVSPDAGRVASTFGSGAPRAKKPSSKVSPTVERKVDRASASPGLCRGRYREPQDLWHGYRDLGRRRHDRGPVRKDRPDQKADEGLCADRQAVVILADLGGRIGQHRLLGQSCARRRAH